MKRAIALMLALLAGIATSVSLVCLSVEGMAFGRGFYQEQYRKLAQAEVIGVSSDDLMRVTDGLIGYLKGERGSMQSTAVVNGVSREVFNERELAHMVDVRALFALLRTVVVACGAVALALLLLSIAMGGTRKAGLGLMLGAGVFIALAGALVFLISRDFTSAFITFHHLFFTNDLWILDPANDILLMMVPQPFFEAISLRIALLSALALIAELALGCLLCIAGKRAKETKM